MCCHERQERWLLELLATASAVASGTDNHEFRERPRGRSQRRTRRFRSVDARASEGLATRRECKQPYEPGHPAASTSSRSDTSRARRSRAAVERRERRRRRCRALIGGPALRRRARPASRGRRNPLSRPRARDPVAGERSGRSADAWAAEGHAPRQVVGPSPRRSTLARTGGAAVAAWPSPERRECSWIHAGGRLPQARPRGPEQRSGAGRRGRGPENGPPAPCPGRANPGEISRATGL